MSELQKLIKEIQNCKGPIVESNVLLLKSIDVVLDNIVDKLNKTNELIIDKAKYDDAILKKELLDKIIENEDELRLEIKFIKSIAIELHNKGKHE